jgi:predicted MFS family arabinose efflux permease
MFAIPVIAPEIARDLGVSTAVLGWYQSMIWLTSIASLVVGGLIISRFGPWRISQACLVLCALGTACSASGWLPMFVIAGTLIGLAHGVETLASSTILARLTPPARQPFIFSFKQTGVQLGGITAGALVPALALAFGWRSALWAVAAMTILAAVLVGFAQRQYPIAPVSGNRISFLQACGIVVRHGGLLRLSLASLAFIAAQVCLNTFLVTFFVAEHKLSLVAAGGYLVACQIGGLIGRLLWGAVAGRWIGTTPLLCCLGAAMSMACVALGLWVGSLPSAAIVALCAFAGLTASGWNGVFLAEISRLAPPGQVASTTSASFMIGSLGLVLAPVIYSAIATRVDFGSAYVVMGLFAALGVAILLWPARRPDPI